MNEDIKKVVEEEWDEFWDRADKYNQGSTDYWYKMRLHMKDVVLKLLEGRRPTERWKL